VEPARWMFAVWKWGMRVHVFGRGFYLGINRIVLFSERYGYKKVYRLGPIALEFI
jgi:hypothetical protein